MADESSEMLWEGAKRIIAALSREVLTFQRRVHRATGSCHRHLVNEVYLEAVNEYEEQCFAHAHRLRSMANSASSSTLRSQRVVVEVDMTAQS
jgi:hypothetical protein